MFFNYSLHPWRHLQVRLQPFSLLLVPIHFKFELVHFIVGFKDHILNIVQSILFIGDSIIQLFYFILESFGRVSVIWFIYLHELIKLSFQLFILDCDHSDVVDQWVVAIFSASSILKCLGFITKHLSHFSLHVWNLVQLTWLKILLFYYF